MPQHVASCFKMCQHVSKCTTCYLVDKISMFLVDKISSKNNPTKGLKLGHWPQYVVGTQAASLQGAKFGMGVSVSDAIGGVRGDNSSHVRNQLATVHRDVNWEGDYYQTSHDTKN